MPIKHYCDFCDEHIQEGKNYYRISIDKVSGEEYANRFNAQPELDSVGATMVCKKCTKAIGAVILRLKSGDVAEVPKPVAP